MIQLVTSNAIQPRQQNISSRMCFRLDGVGVKGSLCQAECVGGCLISPDKSETVLCFDAFSHKTSFPSPSVNSTLKL